MNKTTIILIGALALCNCRDEQVTETTKPVDIGTHRVSFPEVGVSIVQPDGFTKSERFHGIENATTQSSVIVLRISGPFSEVEKGFTAQLMAPRGLELLSKKRLEIEGEPGWLLEATQRAAGFEYGKWIVAFGSDKDTLMVTAMYPTARSRELSAIMKAVATGARRDHLAPPKPDAGLFFKIDASPKLKITRGIGKLLMYTPDGVMPAKSPDLPMFIAAPSYGKVAVDNRRQYATQRLFQTAHTKVSSITFDQPIRVDGLDGFELTADATDKKSGIALRVYQVMLFEEESYILMQGLVGAKLAEEYLPEFKTMARSLQRKRK